MMGIEDQSDNPSGMRQKPSVFMSYAHQDGTNTARRVVRSLEPYCSEVFWDRKLRAGDWQNQLADRIRSHDYFLVVMSPAQVQSQMCQWELRLAQERLKQDDTGTFGIVPIRRFAEHNDEELEKLQYADFSDDFERGFGDLTQIMFGDRRSSWEHLASQSPQMLLAGIRLGQIPASILFEGCERLIVEKVWIFLRSDLLEMRPPLIVGNPELPEEVLAEVEKLIPQAAKRLDGIVTYRLRKAKELLEAHIEGKTQVGEKDYEAAGQCADSLIADVRRFLTLNATSKLDAIGVANINANYEADVAGVFRQSIKTHARAMRLMY